MTYGGLSNEVRRLPPHQRPRLITDVQHSVTTFAPDAPSDAWNDDRAAHPEGRAARFLATSHPRHSSGKAYVPMTTEEVREEVTDHLFRNMRERTRALTFQDIVAEIPRLSHDERLALLEALRQSLREESARGLRLAPASAGRPQAGCAIAGHI